MKKYDENGTFLKQDFTINIKDAKRIVDSLEFTADYDKTEIYYSLKKFVESAKKD